MEKNWTTGLQNGAPLLFFLISNKWNDFYISIRYCKTAWNLFCFYHSIQIFFFLTISKFKQDADHLFFVHCDTWWVARTFISLAFPSHVRKEWLMTLIHSAVRCRILTNRALSKGTRYSIFSHFLLNWFSLEGKIREEQVRKKTKMTCLDNSVNKTSS